MSRKTESPAIPEGGEDAIQAIKEALEIGLGRRGDKLEKYVTFRELQQSGFGVNALSDGSLSVIAPSTSGGGSGGQGSPGDWSNPPIDIGDTDPTPPQRPTNVRARGISMTAIAVSWGEPGYNNHRYAEVFASKADNWAHILTTFDSSRPIGTGNRTPYFMGTQAGTLFIHRNLDSSIPTLQTRFPVSSVEVLTDGTRINISGPFSIGVDQTIILSGSQWENGGFSARVTQVASTDTGGWIIVDQEAPESGTAPAGAEVVLDLSQDDLDAALNPDPIYYWVRFVSQADVVGPVQSEAGVKGSVFIDPAAVLNILTGRIRSSQLANDLLSPIEYVKGPLVPKIDLHSSQIDALEQSDTALVGQISGLETSVNDQGARLDTVEGFIANFTNEATGAESTALWLDELRLGVTGVDSTLERVEAWQTSFDENGPDGASTFGQAYEIVKSNANAGGAMAESIDGLAASYNGSPVWTGLTGVELIAEALTQRFVTATDTQAKTWIKDQLEIEWDNNTFLNQVKQDITANSEGINNSITLKVQADQGGVLTTAGFGIGMQADSSEPGDLTSTFSVSADQFAVMGPGSGRRILAIRDNGDNSTEYVIVVDGPSTSITGDPSTGDPVVVTFPSDESSVRTAFRGRDYKISGSGTTTYGGSTRRFFRVNQVDGSARPFAFGTIFVAISGCGIFPEYNVPFVIDTATSTVGIRGNLIVNGLVRANDGDFDTLAATALLSESIVNYGLMSSKAIIGDALATERTAGWALRIARPNFDSGNNRVLEFSRWLSSSDDPLTPTDGRFPAFDPDDYPQLSYVPNETAFLLGTKEVNGSTYGFAHLRGSLEVGGGSRIWTGTPGSSGDHFVQMDDEFPLMVMPRSTTTDGWGGSNGWDTFTHNASSRSLVRSNALFWVQKNGQAGFNTASNSIYMGQTPMEPPSGSGFVRAITRKLENGDWDPDANARIWVTATLDIACNRYWGRHKIGVYFALYLAHVWDGDYTTSQNDYWATGPIDGRLNRNNLLMPNGKKIGQAPTSDGDPVNAFSLIVRSKVSSAGLHEDPGARAFSLWKSAMLSQGMTLVDQGYTVNNPGQFVLQGIGVVPQGQYKALVVAVERYSHSGTPIWGTPNDNEDTGPGSAINITKLKVTSQQVSGRSAFDFYAGAGRTSPVTDDSEMLSPTEDDSVLNDDGSPKTGTTEANWGDTT